MIWGRGIALALMALAALAFGATGASAGVKHHGGYSYASQKLELPRKSFKRYRLECPKGTHAYGGGISAKAAYGKLHQTQSYPLDTKDGDSKPDDAWGVLVSNKGKKLEGRLYAICGPVMPTYVRTRRSVDPHETVNEIDVSCETNVLGGGLTGSRGIVFQDGGPLDTDIFYSYPANDSSKPGKLKQYAICARIATSYLETNAGEQSPESPVSGKATCSDGFSIVSGGSSTSAMRTTTSAPFGTYKGWLFRGDFYGTFDGTTNVLGACAANIP